MFVMGKRKLLTLSDKLQIIKKIDDGASQANVAREYGINRSTVNEIYKVQRSKIEEFLGTQIDTPVGLMRKKMRKAYSEAVENAVYTWFVVQCSEGAMISGSALSEKAVMFDKQINGDDSTFSASKGWLKRFKDRHGIQELAASDKTRVKRQPELGMGFLGYSDVVCDGDKAIVYLGYNAMMPLKLSHGTVTQTKRGALRHSDIIGKKYGCRLSTLSDKGYVYLLQPTPELWTLNLPHRTQILYFADISLITLQLELKPGSVAVESGTGSGSVSHAFARTIAPNGHLHTFEFHEQRALKAREDFSDHGISHLITVAHRDVLENGFGIDFTVDAVFLDLPCPWRAVSHAKKILKTSGGRICSFSPCIEQVQRTCEELRSLGFSDVTTFECLQRNYEYRTVVLPCPNLGKTSSKDGSGHTGQNPDDAFPPHDSETPGMSSAAIYKDTGSGTTTPDAAEALDGQGETDRGSDSNNGASQPKKPRLYEGAIQDKQGSSLTYHTKCAVPWKDMPGHTGFLTFATLYVVPLDL